MLGHPLVGKCQADRETCELLPVVTIVTDIQAGWAAFERVGRPAGMLGCPAPARRRLLTEWSASRLLAC